MCTLTQKACILLIVPAERTVLALVKYLDLSYFTATDTSIFRDICGEKLTKQAEQGLRISYTVYFELSNDVYLGSDAFCKVF